MTARSTSIRTFGVFLKVQVDLIYTKTTLLSARLSVALVQKYVGTYKCRLVYVNAKVNVNYTCIRVFPSFV